MPQDSSHDVEAIREWLAKESHLPTDFGDLILKKFLHSCYGSLEKTKKCIDRFCTTRATMSEAYCGRDPLDPKLQTAFEITSVVTYPVNKNDELLIHQLDDPNLERLVFYDLVKTFTIQADNWLQHHDFLPDGHIIVFDLKDITLKILSKVNIMFFKDFLVFLLEGMPVRVKQVHAINCPSYYDKLYSLVKPVLPAEICNIINFHTSSDALHNFMDRKQLPVEYGGEAQSIKVQQRHWVKTVVEERETYLNDNMWKADLNKKPRNNAVEAAMTGSFRTLSID